MSESDLSEKRAVRCEVRGCKDDATGTLVYEVGRSLFMHKRKPWYLRIEHPLCEAHSDPKFHLRKGPNWRWEPVRASGGSDQ